MDSERHALDVHENEILDQFTRQAEPFLRRHGGGKQELLELMAEYAATRSEDVLLDVACGPGIVSCFFAERAARVTGLDMVPAMLEQARRLQAERGVGNVEWILGQSTALPFVAESFDCVVTRFSFHHYEHPRVALEEMKRVCRSGGTIVVADVAPSEAAQDSFNRWERLRDPSHTRGLTLAEMKQLGEDAGLKMDRCGHFDLAMDLDDLLLGSFPKPGDEKRLRDLFDDDLRSGLNRIGLAARKEDGSLRLSFPVVVLAWRKR